MGTETHPQSPGVEAMTPWLRPVVGVTAFCVLLVLGAL
jgi:hypothetical protein